MKQLFLFGVFILTASFIFAQEIFSHIGTDDGLPSGEINYFAQDQTGHMWFATWTGLIRYDGYRFKTFRPELGNARSLPDKKVKRLLVDTSGDVWVVTEEHICRYNQITNDFDLFEFEKDHSGPVNISYLAETNGFVVIQSVDGLFAVPIDAQNTHGYRIPRIDVRFPNEISNPYYNIVYGAGDQFFLVSNGADDYQTRIFFPELTIENGKPTLDVKHTVFVESAITTLSYVKRENALYIAPKEGILKLQLDNYKFDKRVLLPGISVRNMLAASNGFIYCAPLSASLYAINLHTGKTDVYNADPNKLTSLYNSNVHSLFEDFSGNLWVGHQGLGISILNLNQKAFFTYRYNSSSPNPLASNAVMCFATTADDAFIGGRTGGVNILKRNQYLESEARFDVLPLVGSASAPNAGGGVWDIKRESDSLLWVATDAGLFRLERNGREWNLRSYGEAPIFKVGYRSIYIDPNQNLWCGTMRNGLVFIPRSNRDGKTFYQFKSSPTDSTSLSDNVVISFLLDSKGRFWVGTNNGLNLLRGRYDQLDLSGAEIPQVKFKRFVATRDLPNFLNNNEINCIFENFNEHIWVATQGGGINILDPDLTNFKHLTLEDGLPSNDVLGIVADELGILWISTSGGLVSYNQHVEHASFTRYGTSDGIQGTMFMVNSYHKALDGELYFGGENGFTRFYPSRIKPNSIRPKISFTHLMIRGRAVDVGDTLKGKTTLKQTLNGLEKLVLPYSKNTIAIGVASIHYQFPKGNSIAYKMEGVNTDWVVISASNRYAYFTNLQPGKYVLQVKAISSDNIESAEVRTLEVEITPPWYLTWYMNALFLILAFSAITLGIVYLINRQRRIYLQRIAQITIESNESKMTFLANIAHELRTPLSLVIAPIEDLIQHDSEFGDKWQEHLGLIQRNSKYLLKLINQIIDFRKLNEGKLKMVRRKTDMVGLIAEVVSNFGGIQRKKKINLKTNLPAQEVMAMVDVQKIEEILYNLLSNAFKHTPDGGKIEVSLAEFTVDNALPKHIRISVFNEGKDISEHDKKRIFDRFFKADEAIDGAGIGLSFSKSLVEMHNGTIWVESVVGKGVEFIVQFPIDIENETPELVESLEWIDDTDESIFKKKLFNPTPVQTEEEGRELQIMVVEDNEELRKFLVGVLSRDYVCLEAADGREAWKQVVEQVPDIIISDVIMPNVDGYELCRMVKESIHTCHIPFIMLTAKNSSEHVIEGYNSGVDAYVTKPFDMQVILSQVARLIKNRELIRDKYKKQNFMVEVSSNNPSKDDEFLNRFRSFLDENLTNTDFNVKEMAVLLDMSTTQLYRKIKSLTGYSPVEFMRIARLHKAHDLLKLQKHSIKEVSYLTGFNNLSYFVKCFREYFGVTPASYRNKGING